MSHNESLVEEAGLAAKFGAVGLVGFAVDAVLLKIGLMMGLGPAWARLISLVCAMQVTFAINRCLVFRCRDTPIVRQWLTYMGSNGFGNFCNYWIFVTLSSLHGQWAASPFVAMPASAFCAYLINYAGARLVVFGRARVAARARGLSPEPRVPSAGAP